MNTKRALEEIFAVSNAVRYAAIYHNGKLVSRMRKGASHASPAESDKYEELVVNPALLTLVKQRGNIGCGGARFLVVRYGNFYQLVIDLPTGHVSVCFELTANPLEHADAIARICA